MKKNEENNNRLEENILDEESCEVKELQDFPDLCSAKREFDEEYQEGLKGQNPNFSLYRVATGWHIASLLGELHSEISPYLSEHDSQKISFLIEMIEYQIDNEEHEESESRFWDYGRIIRSCTADESLKTACMFVLNYAEEHIHEY